MKKSLLAVALLGAFAASAFAAPSVTLYGRLDTGLIYSHFNNDAENLTTWNKDKKAWQKYQDADTFSMDSGISTGSRWGLTGTENIGNVKVGFTLESGFTSDDGQSAQDSRLFGRAAQLFVSGAYGTVYAGRFASPVSDAGDLGLLGDVSAFPNAYGIVGSQKGSTGSAYARYDNSLAYVTPKFAGFQAEAMYSFKADQKKETGFNENSGDTTRYAAAGLKWKGAKAAVVLTGDYTMYGNGTYKDLDDGYSVILGGNYDFGVAKVFAKATYFDNQASVLDSFKLIKNTPTHFVGKDKVPTGAEALEGWGLELGTAVPAFGGKFLATVGYRDAKDVDNSGNKFKRWNAALGYTYAFSKRTSIYSGIGYAQEKADAAKDDNDTPSVVQATVGLVHKF